MKKKTKSSTILKKKSTQQLYKAVAALSTVKDVEHFFIDLFTPAELTAMTDRWQVAIEIFAEKPYRQIHEETEVSITTIGRVARCIHYGVGGYARAYQLMRNSS